MPERAARAAAAAAAAAAERSARGAILSALQDPQGNTGPSTAASGRPSAVPKPPGFRMPPGLRIPQPCSADPVVPPPRHLGQPETLHSDPVSGAAVGVPQSDMPSAETGTSADTAVQPEAFRRGNTKVKRNRRKTATDRSRHRVPTHL